MDAPTFCKKAGISNGMLHYLLKKGYLQRNYFADRLVFNEQSLVDFQEYRASVEKMNCGKLKGIDGKQFKGKVGKYAKN